MVAIALEAGGKSDNSKMKWNLLVQRRRKDIQPVCGVKLSLIMDGLEKSGTQRESDERSSSST
jgi:hypothetical protein